MASQISGFFAPYSTTIQRLPQQRFDIGEKMLDERDLCKSIIDFSFIIKDRLHSPETEVLKSILCILIMEAEDSLEQLAKEEAIRKRPERARSAG